MHGEPIPSLPLVGCSVGLFSGSAAPVRDEAQRIVTYIAKLPELLGKS